METTCPRCGATWEPDASPDVETVIVDEGGEAVVVIGPEHDCDRITEWS